MLNAVHARDGVDVVWLEDLLCDESRCTTELDGILLYRDGGHLSRAGSALIGRRMGLGTALMQRAR